MPRLANRKRERFACEVAACTPYARAYIVAGYADTEWAPYNANRLAHTPEVAARIAELQAAFEKESQIKAAYIQRLLLPIVEADAADLFEPQSDLFAGGNQLKPLSKLPRQLRAAIKVVDIDSDTGRPTKITLHDKIAAGTTLLRSVGGFVDRTEVTGKDGAPVTLEALVLASFQKARPAGDAAAAGSPGDGAHSDDEPGAEPEPDEPTSAAASSSGEQPSSAELMGAACARRRGQQPAS